MAGKWYNTPDTEDTERTQEVEHRKTLSQKLFEMLSNIVPIFGAVHVGFHFGSVLSGLAMFAFLVVCQSISTLLLMNKDEMAEFAAKKMANASDADLESYISGIYRKYLPTTSIIAICGYFAVRMIFKF